MSSMSPMSSAATESLVGKVGMNSAIVESLVGKIAVVKPGAHVKLDNYAVRYCGAAAIIIAENGYDILLRFESNCSYLRGTGWTQRNQVRIEGIDH